jgi:heat shock protein HslJ
LSAAIVPGIFKPIGPNISTWVRFNGNDVAFGSQCNRGDASAKATDDTITFGVPSRNATIPPG